MAMLSRELNVPLLLNGLTLTTTFIFPPPVGAIFNAVDCVVP